MSATDTLADIIHELVSAFEPLAEAVEGPEEFSAFMAALGWDVSNLIGPVHDAAVVATGVRSQIQEDSATTPGSSNLMAGLQQVIGAIRGLTSIGSGDLPASIDAGAFRNEFPRQLLDFLVVGHLLNRRPRVGAFLRLVGVIRVRDVPAAGNRPAYRAREIAWSDLARVFQNPAAVFTDAYRWGQDNFDGTAFLYAAYQLAAACGLDVSVRTPTESERNYLLADATLAALGTHADPVVDWPLLRRRPELEPDLDLGLDLGVLPPTATQKPGLALLPYLRGSAEQSFAPSENLQIRLQASFDMAGGVSLHVRPDVPPEVDIGFLRGALAAAAEFSAAFVYRPVTGSTVTLVGDPKGTRLEAESLTLRGGIRVQTAATPDAFGEVAVSGAALVISLGGGAGDGFLSSVLPNEIKAAFGLTAGVSSLHGVYFTGSAGLEIELPVHISLGPIEIQSATISARPTGAGIPVDLTATLKADLSVLQAVVQNVGVRVELTTPPGGGRLGPFDFAMSFRPPKGVGLAVNAGPVKGGGYLYFDFDNEEYAGALELKFGDVVDLKAVGLITTRMPDGSKGFSLLVIITAEFGTGFQLGYGFKLIGVGGLVGLNRTVMLEALAAGVRTGAVNEILFPRNVVANAPKIISDLRAIFPPKVNTFLVGPMAKLGWGTPTLISLSLGIIIEIPGNVAILGVLALALPDPDDPVLILQVDFIGAVEFDKKRLFFFAAMYDSRILFITMEGEVGVLAAFGDQPNILMSAGGFHPRFDPPPLPFPNPRRISLNILNESWGRIRADTYFALTSNTAQLGAHAELYFGFSAFAVEGNVGFDALMRFSPFYFIIEASATVSLKVAGAGIFTVELALSLEGTTPWRARGHGTIHILCWDVTKDFDQTWGEARAALITLIDLIPILAAEIEKTENWITTFDAGMSPRVTLAPITHQPGVLIFHPLGTLQVSQRAIPLDLTLDKVGTQTPRDAARLTLRETSGNFRTTGKTLGQFAPAQFQNLSDTEKLSRPAFEFQHAGLELSAEGPRLASSRVVRRNVRYEQIVLDTNYRRLRERFTVYVSKLFNHFLNVNAVSQSALSRRTRMEGNPATAVITVQGERYAVVSLETNLPVEDAAAGFDSDGEAREYLRAWQERDPAGAAAAQVIPARDVRRAV